MLIDCGMKKGSSLKCTITQVAENIREATGGHLHLVAITHEHEDHVSGFQSEKEVFEGLTIDKLWLAWTEDPDNPVANQLREKYHDVLLGLAAASGKLNSMGAADRSDARVRDIVGSLMEFELSDAEVGLAATDPAQLKQKIKGRTNKEGILVVKRRADQRDGTEYLRPHSRPRTIGGVAGLRFFVLGPPEVEARLKDMDPKGEEEFHFAAAEARSFLAAVDDSGTDPAVRDAHQPFAGRYRIAPGPRDPADSPLDQASDDASVVVPREPEPREAEFFRDYYLSPNSPEASAQDWRRIDGDWLRSSEQFALRMNSYVNNTSLVLAIELPRTRKVLLFVGDAQRGNWISWHEGKWTSENGLADGEEVTCSDLLGRTVFYKVGHHGSHNATLNKGGLQEMARGPFSDQFVAMISAHQKWAESITPPWHHPLDAILRAVRKKAKGRVLVLDREPEKPGVEVSDADWNAFLDRCPRNDLFYEFTVEDTSPGS